MEEKYGDVDREDTTVSLTPKREKFCLVYMETNNATEAYRRSFNCENTSDKTINEAASRLLSNSKIKARLAELRAPVIARAQITLEQHLNDLKRLRDMAEASEKYGPAVQAEMARGKASGLYVDKIDAKVDGNVTVEIVKYSSKI